MKTPTPAPTERSWLVPGRIGRAVWLVLQMAARVGALTAVIAGCSHRPAAPPTGLLDVTERPAEAALLAGLRAYDEGQYPLAESQLRTAIDTGLASPRDRAAAQKHLAFIYCTSERLEACEQSFREARAADPRFALARSEAGHPQWGPVYRRLAP